jgi:hypothetical protein
MQNSHETMQSAISYGSAGLGSATALTLDSIAGVAESVTILLACAVVAVRLVYDVTRYIRYLKEKKED